MNTNSTKQVPVELQGQIRKAYEALMKKNGGARRRGQQVMIGAIARAVSNAKRHGEVGTGARLAAVQAPTGSGKTFSYALGAIPVALANDLKVVISCTTVALQEQLFSRDLVDVAAVLPEMKAILVKGRGRYACPVQMEKALTEEHHAGAALAHELLTKLENGEWDGDVDSLRQAPEQQVWATFTNDRNGCTGRKCSSYNACPYYKTRKSMEAANVFVVNHDLLLADQAAGNYILPKIADTVLIVDEAHHLATKALGALANSHALGDAQKWVRSAGKLVSLIRSTDRNGACGVKAARMAETLDVMGGTLMEAKAAIESMGKTTDARDPKRPVRFTAGKLPEWLARVALDCRASSEQAKAAITDLMEALQGEDGDSIPDKKREAIVSDVGRAAGRIDSVVGVWRLMTEKEVDGEPVAKWIEVQGEQRDLRVCVSPVGVGQYLHDTLWTKVAASVHLSATMTTVGGFAPYLRESGLSRTEGVVTLEVDSPFDYERQATLVVPRQFANPKDARAHTAALIDMLPKAIRTIKAGQGGLVLFSSWNQLREVAEGMPQEVRDVMLMQGQMSKRDVLATHHQAIKDGRKSVIFGTSSYEEGVDLRGDACVLVVVAKIQFTVPTDPVSETLKEFMESMGRSHFDEIVVPEACKRLAQSAGRLLRSETDSGSVIVADPRLVTTRYGRAMLAALPKFRMESQLAA